MLTQEEIAKKKTIGDKIAELQAKRAELELGGGKDRIDRQHASGKLTARERIDRLSGQGELRGNRAVLRNIAPPISEWPRRSCRPTAW